jgi:hypothetical protein
MFDRSILAAAAIALGGAITCGVPAAAQGTRGDRAYCDRLVEMYGRYLSGDELGQRRAAAGSSLEGRVGVAKCQQGDTATGIPILERLLIANGFSLPR